MCRAEELAEATESRLLAIEASLAKLGVTIESPEGQEAWGNNTVFVAETQDFVSSPSQSTSVRKPDAHLRAKGKEDMSAYASKSDLCELVTKAQFELCISELRDTSKKLRAQFEHMAGQGTGANGAADRSMSASASNIFKGIAIEMSGRPDPELISPKTSPRVQMRTRPLRSHSPTYSAEDERWPATVFDRMTSLEARTDALERAMSDRLGIPVVNSGARVHLTAEVVQQADAGTDASDRVMLDKQRAQSPKVAGRSHIFGGLPRYADDGSDMAERAGPGLYSSNAGASGHFMGGSAQSTEGRPDVVEKAGPGAHVSPGGLYTGATGQVVGGAAQYGDGRSNLAGSPGPGTRGPPAVMHGSRMGPLGQVVSRVSQYADSRSDVAGSARPGSHDDHAGARGLHVQAEFQNSGHMYGSADAASHRHVDRLEALELTCQDLSASTSQLESRFDEVKSGDHRSEVPRDSRGARSISARTKDAGDNYNTEFVGADAQAITTIGERSDHVGMRFQESSGKAGKPGLRDTSTSGRALSVEDELQSIRRAMDALEERFKMANIAVDSELQQLAVSVETRSSQVEEMVGWRQDIDSRCSHVQSVADHISQRFKAVEDKLGIVPEAAALRQQETAVFEGGEHKLAENVQGVRDRYIGGDSNSLQERVKETGQKPGIGTDQAGMEVLVSDLRDEMLHHVRELEEIVLSSSAVSGEHMAELHAFATREVEIHAKIREIHDELKGMREKNASTSAGHEAIIKRIEALESTQIDKHRVLNDRDLEMQRTRNDVEALSSRVGKLEHASDTIVAFGKSVEALDRRLKECERVAEANERLEELTESFQVCSLVSCAFERPKYRFMFLPIVCVDRDCVSRSNIRMFFGCLRFILGQLY
jgi:hypothetical protein